MKYLTYHDIERLKLQAGQGDWVVIPQDDFKALIDNYRVFSATNLPMKEVK